MTETKDNRSKNFIFVPFCSLAQAFHAQGLVKYEWGGNLGPLLTLLAEHDVNMIQMPCPETLYHGYSKGLNRAPAGFKYYDTPEFWELCNSKADEVVAQIIGLSDNGFIVVAILGMEYSPSCAVSLQWPPRKGETSQGIFIRQLSAKLYEKGFNIPILGINRRSLRKTTERVENALIERDRNIRQTTSKPAKRRARPIPV